MLDRSISYLKVIVKYCEDIASIHELHENSYEKYYTNKGYQYSISFCVE